MAQCAFREPPIGDLAVPKAMLPTRRLAALLCAAALLVSAAVAQGQIPDPASGLFEDYWYQVRLSGNPAGYMHTSRTRAGDQIESRLIMSLKLRRAGAMVEITSRRVDLETVAGKPLGFTTEQQMGGALIRSVGTIADGSLTLVRSQAGVSTTDRYKWHPNSVLSWGSYRQQRSHELSEGTTYAFWGYDPDLSVQMPVKTTHTVSRRETVKLPNREVQAWHVVAVTAVAGAEYRTEEWLDAAGVSVRSKLAILGMSFEIVQCTKQQAAADFDPAEMFVGSLIQVDRAIDAAGVAKVVLRLRTNSSTDLHIPESRMQRVRRLDDGSYELTIRRIDRAALVNAAATRDGPEAARNLRATLYANCDDPRITKMAAEAVGTAKHAKAYPTVDRLRKYVSRIIIDKSLGVGFATAGDVARMREGDCTEHAVLLTALARARRIPARGVIGLVYVPRFAGKRNIFGFHMWTQVLLDNKWIDLDAALNQTDVDPTHIALFTTELGDDPMGGASVLQMMQLMGGLSIEVVSAE